MAAEIVHSHLPTTPIASHAVEALVHSFLDGRNERTLRAYRHDLADFASFIGARSIQAAAEQFFGRGQFEANVTALSYRADLLRRGLQPASVNRRLAALRSFVKLANTLGIVGWELAVRNERTTPFRDTRGPNLHSVRRLLAAVSRRTDSQGIRDFALLRLLYDLALRRQEVVTLDVAHLALDRFSVSVLRKGQSERQPLTLPPATASALARWLEVRGTHDGALFLNFDRARKGGRITGTSINRIVQRWGHRIGVRLTVHQLRHAAITHALDATNGDVRAVARFSGHKKIETLLIYDDNRRDLGGDISRIISASADPSLST